MKRTISIIIIVFVAFGSIAIGIGSLSADAYSSWSEAYKDFVLNKKYLSSDQDYSGKNNKAGDPQSFALHDMNSDGTPELIIDSGIIGAAAVNVYHVYQYKNDSTKYADSFGCYGVGYITGTEFNGLFCDFAHTGSCNIDYLSLNSNGSINRERLVSGTDIPEEGEDYGGFRVTEITENTKLYKAFYEAGGLDPDNLLEDYYSGNHNVKPLILFTLSEINSMGWPTFCKKYGYTVSENTTSTASNSDLTATQQKELEKFLEGLYGIFVFNNNSFEYDYTKVSDPSIMVLILNYQNFASFYPGKADYSTVEYEDKPDPRKKYDKFTYGGGYSYIKSNANQVDWVVKNLFNCSDSNIKEMISRGEKKLNSDSNEFCNSFYKEGNYYYSYTAGIGGNTDWYARINSVSKSGDNYLVYYSIITYEYDDSSKTPINTYNAYAQLQYKKIDGKNYWSLYKNSKNKFSIIDVSKVEKKDDKYTIEYLDGTSDTFDYNLDYYINKADSCKYDPDLAYMLMSIANAAYDKSKVNKMYDTLGFEKKFVSEDYDLPLILDTKVRYSLGTKTMDNGNSLVLVDIAGTSGDLGDFTAMEWWSDADLGLTTEIASGYHHGFEQAANYLMEGLDSFILKNKIKKSEAIFVVTGHSRGGAVGNIISNKLGVKKSNLFNYNFACPDVAVNTPVYWNTLGTNDNIFNISCNQDIVSMVPGELGDLAVIIKTNQWGKYGRSLWFCYDWADAKYDNIYFQSHDPAYYLAYLRQRKPESELKDYFAMKANIPNPLTYFNLFGFFCPVDVTLTDDSGNVIAQVINDKVTEQSEEAYVIVSQGHKIIQVFNDKHVNVSLEGTDKGNMTVIMKEYKSPSLEVTQNVSFEDISLSKGTQIKTEWGGDIKPESINLIDGKTGEIINSEKSTEITDNDASVESTSNKFNKTTIIIIIAAVIVALLIAAIIFIILNNKKKQEPVNEAEDAKEIPQETESAPITTPLPAEEKAISAPSASKIEYSCKQLEYGGKCAMCKKEAETLYLINAKKGDHVQSHQVCRNCGTRIIAKFKKQNETV